jgi:predicted nucleic acid-binding protein
MIVLLDSGPLSYVTNPRANPASLRCSEWREDLIRRGHRPVIPEIVDYELRRVLLKADKRAGLRALDLLVSRLDYAPLTTAAMRRAAEFWAAARKAGRPTAPDERLDCDAILAAQAAVFEPAGQAVVIATTNVRHLSLWVDAQEWHAIT